MLWTFIARGARAEDGSNEVCPAFAAEADDVRERVDARGKLVHQLRLRDGSVVEEVAILHQGEHAVARTEITRGPPARIRIARSKWKDDHIVAAECEIDGVRTASAAYGYLGERLVAVEKRFPDRVERVSFVYDADGALVQSEVRDGNGQRKSVQQIERAPLGVPIALALSAGGSYQSDTELYDFNAGFGLHRRPKTFRYGSDPLEVNLDAVFRFHRAAGLTSTDQTTLRFGVDYREVLPRFSLFSFASTDRNLPANLRLNLEVAVLGVKFDLVPRGQYQLDVSFAPVWNFRSIVSPTATGANDDQTLSKLRGSLRVRFGVHERNWSLLNTLEFLPTLFGDDVSAENDFWNRSVLRNTITLEVALGKRFSLREEAKYTRDPAMRAQASCANSDNPLCRGYALASTTSLVLNLEL